VSITIIYEDIGELLAEAVVFSAIDYDSERKGVDVDAWLLDKTDASAAAKTSASPSVEFSYTARAETLVKAGLMDEANVEAATATLENEGDKEAEDEPAGFDDALENAGFFLTLRA
jgi:hypothetical protein